MWFVFGNFHVSPNELLGFTFGVTQMFAFLDTNMLVFPTRKCGVGGSKPTRGPNAKVFASQWKIGLTYRFTVITYIWKLLSQLRIDNCW